MSITGINRTSTTNATTFAGHYLDATARLLDAIGEPANWRFELAYGAAIKAIGAAYTGTSPDGGMEWELGQQLARTIRDTARESGCSVGGK